MKHFSTILHEWSEVFVHRSMRDFKRFMDDTGLSPSQINTLMRLHYSGPCGVSDIAEHLGISNAAASQMIDKLVQAELVERAEAPDDRRMKQITLAPHGAALVERGIDARRCWMEELTCTLSPEQQAAIADALAVLTEAARRLESES